MSDRRVVDVPTPAEGWEYPWDNVAEIAAHLGPDDWTLVGGLMVQLHFTIAGIEGTRATGDIDMVVHLETSRGRAARVHETLTTLGYAPKVHGALGPLGGDDQAHRYVRESAGSTEDLVDVMRADHAAPSVLERLGRHAMLPIDGTTQALKRTFNARLVMADGTEFLVSVPDAYGALILKCAAHKADGGPRRERHVSDAVGLLACVGDPFEVFAEHSPSGSDGSRLNWLAKALESDGSSSMARWGQQVAETARANLGVLQDQVPEERSRWRR